jgi:hypothetical protein
MMYFVVDQCDTRACQHWRIGNKCTKHNLSIPENAKYVLNIHNSSICEVRRQIDRYRLEHLLEE